MRKPNRFLSLIHEALTFVENAEEIVVVVVGGSLFMRGKFPRPHCSGEIMCYSVVVSVSLFSGDGVFAGYLVCTLGDESCYLVGEFACGYLVENFLLVF